MSNGLHLFMADSLLDHDDIRRRLSVLSVDELKEMQPKAYGFRRIGDLMAYLIFEEESVTFKAVYKTLGERLDRLPAYKAYADAENPSRDQSEEGERLFRQELHFVVEEMTEHWRQHGKL